VNKIKWMSLALAAALAVSVGAFAAAGSPSAAAKSESGAAGTATKTAASQTSQGGGYSTDQALSDKAQLSTIAFSGLAFLTGSDGADTFFPPGKVADFFGFQYMRDVDAAGYGHNTQFLSRAANNVLYILNDSQKAQLVALAKSQAPLYISFAYNRLPLMNAFRRNLEGDLPAGATALDSDTVAAYVSNLYDTDAEMSCGRAVAVGKIIQSFTQEQKDYLAKMEFDDFSTWPDVAEDSALKSGLTNSEFVCVMTYASELFSWFKGSVEADAYFCPERHGTYFGGFFMKDYPAMNDPDYFISTSVTGDKGQAFLDILTDSQRKLIEDILPAQKAAMTEIAQLRTEVSTELRKAMTGGTVDQQKVYSLIERYGELDGTVSALYAQRFAEVNRTLTDTQRAALVRLRDLDAEVKGVYLFSTPVDTPVLPDTDFFFGTAAMPADAGSFDVPAGFGSAQVKPTGVKVTLNGKQISFDVQPFIRDGRTIVPARAIAEALGAQVLWDSGTRSAVITKGEMTIRLPIGSKNAQVNGKTVALDVPAEIQNGRTLVPLRFLAENLRFSVSWDAAAQTAELTD
jgi:uncharacterized membrane protein